MPSAVVPLLTFLAVVLGVGAVYSLLSDLFLRDRQRVQERLEIEFHNKQHERAKQSLLLKSIEPLTAEAADGIRVIRLSWRERLQTMLDQSGLDLSLNRLLTMCAIGAAVGVVAGILFKSVLLGLPSVAVGMVAPLGYVNLKRNARLEALRRQLSDAFDLMARILRSGQSLTQAMQAVAKEFPSPIAEEFAYCSEQQNLGLAPEISMRDLAKRTGLIEMSIFIVAVLVQKQVGGNLSEILEKLAFVVRQRYKTRGTIRTLTAEGRMQAGVLMTLPPLLLVAMLIVNHDYAIVLIEKPFLIGGMAFFMALGGLWIRKIVNFDF
jgi:tight adherence protein B